jgi:hypothetical protein
LPLVELKVRSAPEKVLPPFGVWLIKSPVRSRLVDANEMAAGACMFAHHAAV